MADTTTQGATVPKRLHIMYVGNLVNGFILAGFGNAEIFPGEKIAVRGSDGINYDHATKLVLSGRGFIWVDEHLTPLETAPEPTPEEHATCVRTGAYNLPGAPTQEYPEYHLVDPNWAGPIDPEKMQRRAAQPTPGEAADAIPRFPLAVGGDADRRAVMGGGVPAVAAEAATDAARAQANATGKTGSVAPDPTIGTPAAADAGVTGTPVPLPAGSGTPAGVVGTAKPPATVNADKAGDDSATGGNAGA